MTVFETILGCVLGIVMAAFVLLQIWCVFLENRPPFVPGPRSRLLTFADHARDLALLLKGAFRASSSDASFLSLWRSHLSESDVRAFPPMTPPSH